MRYFVVVVSLLAAACTSPSPTTESEAPPAVEELFLGFEAAGISVRGEKLQSLREFPGCPLAELRYRFRFADDFVNVSRYSSEKEAKACLAAFRRTVSKAGESAWERMSEDISTTGRWLFFFPPDASKDGLREKVLSVLRKAGRQGT